MTTTTRDDYVLGRSAGEHERLGRQARFWEPESARLLDRIGLGRRARCLDAGCGTGEAMRLMAERVGPKGRVTGLDVDEALGARAVADLHAAGHVQCGFEAFDVESGDTPRDAPYDLVFARFLLIHVDDPALVLRRLWDWVAPGGHLVVQDYDLLTGAVLPAHEAVEEFRRIALDTFLCAGRDVRIGMRLPAVHVEAGVGAPDGIEVGARVGLLPELAPMYEAVYRSLQPAAVALGLTTDARSDQWLEAFARATAGACGHAALWPLLLGTWKRKEAA